MFFFHLKDQKWKNENKKIIKLTWKFDLEVSLPQVEIELSRLKILLKS